MRFTSFEFPVFLAVVLGVYWCLPRRGQNLLLLLASYVFYGWVHPWFCALIAGSTTLDYLCARAMDGADARRRRVLLGVSLAGNLGLLAAFKYWDFFALSVQDALRPLGLELSPPMLDVVLPVGISFYTFQSLSYTIDVARGLCAPRRSFVDVAVFVSLFPQLVAGPIERARSLLPQVESPRRLRLEAVESALWLIAWGYFKKLVIADQVVIYVDRVFELEQPSIVVLAAGAVGFAVQILADFSAYTDIARGCARLLGFELMENFRAPYAATSPSDFWRRWHISFSTWIRDYLYIPLGGSRGGRARFVLAATLALGLSGLWHGASWNFVFWGLYHAALVIAYHVAFRGVGARFTATLGERPTRAVACATTFVLVLVGWVIFRQQDLDRLVSYASAAVWRTSPAEWSAGLGVLAFVLALATPMLIGPSLVRAGPALRVRRAAASWACVLATFVFGREAGVDFIYFVF